MLASASRVPPVAAARRAASAWRSSTSGTVSTTPTTESFGDPVSLLQPEGEEPATDLRGHRHLGRLEVAEGVGAFVAAGGDRNDAEKRQCHPERSEGGMAPLSVTHGFSLAVRGVIPRVVRYLDRAWASSTRWRSSVSRASSTSVRDST